MRTSVLRILLIVIAGISSVSVLECQTLLTVAVHGRVIDDSTRAPLAAVNIFIAGTTIYTASDTNGYYRLRGIPYGTHSLVVSLVGYETVTHILQLNKPAEQTINFKLKPRVYSIPAMEITERFDDSWQDRLKEFSSEFIGMSLNGHSCRIMNPEVLDFLVDSVTGGFKASAPRPLIIENDALGYRIMAILDDFERSTGSIRYSAHLRFEKLQAGDSTFRIVWRRNRLLTYRCSLRYFLCSVIHQQCAANGFVVEKSEGPSWPGTSHLGMNRPDLITLSGDSLFVYERRINFPGFLRVTYQNEREPEEFTAFRRNNGSTISMNLEHQTSWIEMKAAGAAVDLDGNLIYPYSIKAYGLWAFQRIADTLPEDYDPHDTD